MVSLTLSSGGTWAGSTAATRTASMVSGASSITPEFCFSRSTSAETAPGARAGCPAARRPDRRRPSRTGLVGGQQAFAGHAGGGAQLQADRVGDGLQAVALVMNLLAQLAGHFRNAQRRAAAHFAGELVLDLGQRLDRGGLDLGQLEDVQAGAFDHAGDLVLVQAEGGLVQRAGQRAFCCQPRSPPLAAEPASCDSLRASSANLDGSATASLSSSSALARAALRASSERRPAG